MAKKKKTETEEMYNPRKIYNPKEVYDMLNEYVIGQDEAKKTLSVAVCNHQGGFYGTYIRHFLVSTR